MVSVWFLWVWAIGIPVMEGGRYVSLERCERAGRYQAKGYPPHNKPLRWKCEYLAQ